MFDKHFTLSDFEKALENSIELQEVVCAGHKMSMNRDSANVAYGKIMAFREVLGWMKTDALPKVVSRKDAIELISRCRTDGSNEVGV